LGKWKPDGMKKKEGAVERSGGGAGRAARKGVGGDRGGEGRKVSGIAARQGRKVLILGGI